MAGRGPGSTGPPTVPFVNDLQRRTPRTRSTALPDSRQRCLRHTEAAGPPRKTRFLLSVRRTRRERRAPANVSIVTIDPQYLGKGADPCWQTIPPFAAALSPPLWD